MEDSIALWRAFQTAGTDVSSAFKLYEQHRRPVRGNLNKAAEGSIAHRIERTRSGGAPWRVQVTTPVESSRSTTSQVVNSRH